MPTKNIIAQRPDSGTISGALNRIAELLFAVGTPAGVLPPTALYNEGWMLRLVLDWFSRQAPSDHALSFLPGARWRSEGLLPSQFRARARGDSLAESRTHADGVIGHLAPPSRRGDVQLTGDARQVVVVEAKLASGLAPGTTRAKEFDQAARNVACIAELIHRQPGSPSALARIGFVLIAPKAQIDTGAFGELCTPASIERKVRTRVEAYQGSKAEWLDQHFLPMLEAMRLDVLSWEGVLAHISSLNAADGAMLEAFYERCLEHCRLGRGS